MRLKQKILRLMIVIALSIPVFAQADTTERVNVDGSGNQANGFSGGNSIAVSADGRYVVFESQATNLVTASLPTLPTGTVIPQLYVHDRTTGINELVSVNSSGAPADYGGTEPTISSDGRFVAFTSGATNLDLNDTNDVSDIYVRDRLLGTTERVSFDTSGASWPYASYGPNISGDGRFVAYQGQSVVTLPDGSGYGFAVTLVYDRVAGTTEHVAFDMQGNPLQDGSESGVISFDGRFVAFSSRASTLVPGDTNGRIDVFVRDRLLGTTERVSLDSQGNQMTVDSNAPSISADGRFIAYKTQFQVSSPDPRRRDMRGDIFVYDRIVGSSELVSVDVSGKPGSQDGPNSRSQAASISADGRFIAFSSSASNLVPNDTNSTEDVFVRDRKFGVTERVSVSSDGTEGDSIGWDPVISANGYVVAFQSDDTNLVPNDTNGDNDVFVRVRDPIDADDDGVQDSIQTGTSSFSDTNAPPTTGTITNTGGLSVGISDSPDPTQGVIIKVGAGTGTATFNACGFPLELSAGSRMVVTCGSITVNVLEGLARLTLGCAGAVVDVPAGSIAKLTQGGAAMCTAANLGDADITVTANGITTTIGPGEQFVGAPPNYMFSSFSVNALTIRQRLNTLFLLSNFGLGTGSNGIDPAQDAVTFKIGSFTTTIPAGAFRKGPGGAYAYAGKINDVAIEALIAPLRDGRFAFQAAAYQVNLNGTTNPVAVELSIGDDRGMTQTTATIR